MNVISLAALWQSSDSVTQHGAAQEPRKKKIKTQPTPLVSKFPPTSEPKTHTATTSLVGPLTEMYERAKNGGNNNKPIKKNHGLEGHR